MTVQRGFQVLLIVSSVALSWLGMMAVHEVGHVLHALASGGTVLGVELHPLRFSRTAVWPNPHPHLVAWGGFVWGCLLPLLAWAAAGAVRWRGAFLLRFFAGLCLVSNGAYLAAGWLSQAGDARELLEYGTRPWVMMLVGLPLMSAGLGLWHGLGPAFGLGAARGRVDRGLAVGVAVVLAVVAAVELALGPPPEKPRPKRYLVLAAVEERSPQRAQRAQR